MEVREVGKSKVIPENLFRFRGTDLVLWLTSNPVARSVVLHLIRLKERLPIAGVVDWDCFVEERRAELRDAG